MINIVNIKGHNARQLGIPLNSLLVLQNFTTAQKSGNILLTYLKAIFI